MMQDRHPPSFPSDVDDLDSDEILEDDVLEEIVDLDDSISESTSSSGSENTDSPQKDDAVCVFRGHASKLTVFCCSLSRNGELAATGGEDDRAYIWNTNTGEIIFSTGINHDDSVIFSEFNYNNKYVATADMRGGIKLWKISDKTCVWETHLFNDINWVKWHHSCSILIAGLITGEVYMLKPRKEDFKTFAQGTGDKSMTGIIFPDGKRAALGYCSGTIHVIDLKSATIMSTTPPDKARSHGHSSAINALDCYMDNNLLISVSLQNQTILSTARNGKVICILQDLNKDGNDHTNHVECAAFCKDLTFPAAATGTVDEFGKIYIWDIFKQTLRHEMEQVGGISTLVWKATLLFTAGLDGNLRCFDAKAGRCLRIFSGHKMGLFDLCISSDGKKALTVSDDGSARIFDISSIC